MIETIITDNPIPRIQTGKSMYFSRRKPNQSEIINNDSLQSLFNHIRMLDAEGYPKAFLERDSFRYEITRPALKTNEILADVRITRIKGDSE